jgi:hypothetical protein
MANVKRPRAEDPQAETRATPPPVPAAPGVAIPRVVPPTGGAPKLGGGDPGFDPGLASVSGVRVRRAPAIENPSTGPLDIEKQKWTEVPGERKPLPTWDEVKATYDARAGRGTWGPVRGAAQPWKAEQAQTALGRMYKQGLDSSTFEEAPKPVWTIGQIKEAEPDFVAKLKDRLWEMYTEASESERNTVFMQGIKQNPEYAAATIVRRMLDKAVRHDQYMTGETVPTLGEAAREQLEMSSTWRWLNYVLQNSSGQPVTGPPVPPPQAPRAGKAR